MHDVEETFEQQELLGRAQGGANHHAVELVPSDDLAQDGVGRFAEIDQAANHLVPQGPQPVELRVNESPDQVRSKTGMCKADEGGI